MEKEKEKAKSKNKGGSEEVSGSIGEQFIL